MLLIAQVQKAGNAIYLMLVIHPMLLTTGVQKGGELQVILCVIQGGQFNDLLAMAPFFQSIK